MFTTPFVCGESRSTADPNKESCGKELGKGSLGERILDGHDIDTVPTNEDLTCVYFCESASRRQVLSPLEVLKFVGVSVSLDTFCTSYTFSSPAAKQKRITSCVPNDASQVTAPS